VLTFLELFFHLPVTLWAIPALLRNDPRVPLALLAFGLEMSLTTVVCLAEMLGMYKGYLAFGESELGGDDRQSGCVGSGWVLMPV
jgi:hypothetical protein